MVIIVQATFSNLCILIRNSPTFIPYDPVTIVSVKTHLPLVPDICVSESGQHWFRYGLVAYSAPSHYLNQFWILVNWTLRNKLRWNFNQNTKLYIHENASENIVCETSTILSRGKRVNNLMSNWRHTIAWNNDGKVLWRYMMSPGHTNVNRWFITVPSLARFEYLLIK